MIPPSKSRAGAPACTFGGADKPGGPGEEPYRYSPAAILEDALSVVFASDEESSIPEPHLRFIARADRLCKEIRKRLDAAPSGAPNEGFTAPAGDIAPGLPIEDSPAPSPNLSSLTPVASSPSDNRAASRAPPAR